MEQSPSSEADSRSANKEISRLLWNPKLHYRDYKSQPLAPMLSQVHPVHNFLPYFPKIHYDILFPSVSRSSEWSVPFKFSRPKCLHVFLIAPMRTTFPAPLILLDLLVKGTNYVVPHEVNNCIKYISWTYFIRN
jgi:hypothetical protein